MKLLMAIFSSILKAVKRKRTTKPNPEPQPEEPTPKEAKVKQDYSPDPSYDEDQDFIDEFIADEVDGEEDIGDGGEVRMSD